MIKPDTVLSLIAVSDIGAAAAAAIGDPDRFRAQEVKLAGERLTMRETAAVLSTVLGLEVEAPSLSLEQAVAKGMPEIYATQMLNVFDANAHPERMRELELPTTGFAEWAERNIW